MSLPVPLCTQWSPPWGHKCPLLVDPSVRYLHSIGVSMSTQLFVCLFVCLFTCVLWKEVMCTGCDTLLSDLV